MSSIIRLSGVSKTYRTKEIETQALENVNLEVGQGEFMSIMGPSGCGKSTLLNIIGLLDKPTTGTIEIAGTNLDGISDRRLAAFRNANLGFVFQSFHLINSINVIDNVEVPLLYRSISSRERRRLAREVLESRTEPPHEALSVAAFRWSMPACRHCSCHHRKSWHNPCRRAYRQPRFKDGAGDNGHTPWVEQGRWAHNSHGYTQ